MRPERILLAGPDDTERAALRAGLCQQGFDAVEASTVEETLTRLPSFSPEAVLADVGLPGAPAPALVTRARALGSDAAFVLATPAGTLESAVAAMRAGAESYLLKPLEAEHVAVVLEKALESRRLRRESGDLHERVRERYHLVGSAPELAGVREMMRRAAPTKATVLVAGEPGTGKELVAQALHEASPRRDRAFLKVSCAALSEALVESAIFGHEPGAFGDAAEREIGSLEQASGGTLLLEEVSNLSPAAQVKLLRVLQHSEFERAGGRDTVHVDVRVVATTHRDLAEEVRAGRFRDDLYYRLNVVSLHLPPLRSRKGDIPALVNHFLARTGNGGEVRGLTPGALSTLFAHEWPGNVRELETVVDHAARRCRGGEIGVDDLPPVLRGARPEACTASALIPGATLFEIEREAILRTLEQAGGSTARAAEVLGISVRKIQYRLKEYRTGENAAHRRAAEPGEA